MIVNDHINTAIMSGGVSMTAYLCERFQIPADKTSNYLAETAIWRAVTKVIDWGWDAFDSRQVSGMVGFLDQTTSEFSLSYEKLRFIFKLIEPHIDSGRERYADYNVFSFFKHHKMGEMFAELYRDAEADSRTKKSLRNFFRGGFLMITSPSILEWADNDRYADYAAYLRPFYAIAREDITSLLSDIFDVWYEYADDESSYAFIDDGEISEESIANYGRMLSFIRDVASDDNLVSRELAKVMFDEYHEFYSRLCKHADLIELTEKSDFVDQSQVQENQDNKPALETVVNAWKSYYDASEKLDPLVDTGHIDFVVEVFFRGVKRDDFRKTLADLITSETFQSKAIVERLQAEVTTRINQHKDSGTLFGAIPLLGLELEIYDFGDETVKAFVQSYLAENN